MVPAIELNLSGQHRLCWLDSHTGEALASLEVWWSTGAAAPGGVPQLGYPRIAEAGHHGRGDVESVAPFENGGQKSLHRKDFIVDGLDGRGIGRHLHGHIARSVSAMPTRDVVDDPGDLIRGVRIDQ